MKNFEKRIIVEKGLKNILKFGNDYKYVPYDDNIMDTAIANVRKIFS